MIESLIISLVVIIVAYLAKFKEFKYGLEISFIILTTFVAIRYDWGNDYSGYLNAFQRIGGYSSFKEAFDFERFEVGWVFLNWVFQPIGFFGFTIVLTIFEYFVLYKIIKRHIPEKWYWFAIFIFTLSPAFMLVTSSMMRQFLAMTVFMIAVEYIINRRWLVAMALVFLASTFHTSAFILLPFCFIGFINFTITLKWAIGIFIVYLILYFSAAVIFKDIFNVLLEFEQFERYEVYLGVEMQAGSTGLGVIFNMLFMLLLLLNHRYQHYQIKIIFILFFIYNFFHMFGSIAPLTGRLAYYFIIYMIVVYPWLFQTMKKNIWHYLFMGGFVLITVRGFFLFFDPSDVWYEKFHNYHTIFSAPAWM